MAGGVLAVGSGVLAVAGGVLAVGCVVDGVLAVSCVVCWRCTRAGCVLTGVLGGVLGGVLCGVLPGRAHRPHTCAFQNRCRGIGFEKRAKF